GITVTVLDTGQLEVTAAGNDIEDLKLRVEGRLEFNAAFSNDPVIEAGTSDRTNSSLFTPAVGTNLLSELYNSSGSRLDLNRDIEISGSCGSEGKSGTLAYDPVTTTLNDLANAMYSTFDITFGSVEINNRGCIEINGDQGADFAITGVKINSVDDSSLAGTPVFDTAFQFTEQYEARDNTTYGVTTMVYDSLGGVHNLTLNFSKRYGENYWTWVASIDGMGEILEGGSGTAQFTSDGFLSSFSISSSGGMVIDLQNGSELLNINIDPGEIGAGSSLMQYNSDTSLRSRDLNGQGMGSLETISIDRSGVINGQFSNGMNRDLAQIAMADFNNPSGLNRVGENMFILSPNSGVANTVYAGTNARGMITPGELEMSNVDLAGQFTEMITAQRGFQANARIISVGDQMLTELVNLKK
ncbi:MAG: flagellar hook-basal body complex protein, partial [Candidatus Krumholzibacteriota bacterium]|nr:flagellar hook-basal body complex protein [Candidatus Krumholzibacteriota bacterium]